MDVLDLFDDDSKTVVFNKYWEKLQHLPHAAIDLDILRVCIKLLPPFIEVSNLTQKRAVWGRMWRNGDETVRNSCSVFQ